MRPSFLFAGLTLAALPALAQQSVSFGLQGGFTTPGGDMTTHVGSDASLSLGLQVRVNFRGGHAIVPRLDQVSFKGDRSVPGPLGMVNEHAEQKLTSLGVDYNWFTSRTAGEGFYISTGLGFLQKEDTYTLPPGYYYAYGDPNDSKSRFYFSIGMGGVIAKHVDLSLRLQIFNDEKTGEVYYSNGTSSNTYSTSTNLTLGVAYHF